MELKTVKWSFEGIKAVIIYHRFRGSKLKTLLIEFPKNVLTLNTKCRFRMIRYICNNIVPQKLWNLIHEEGQRVYLKGVFSTLNIPQENSIILHTAVDMENSAIKDERFEAKVIALQDLDIRSNNNPDLQATGTGSDNLVIVSLGTDPKINCVSGHVKIGEIMAGAVTLATKVAIVKCRRGK